MGKKIKRFFASLFLGIWLDFGTQDGTWPGHDSREIAPQGVQDHLEDVAVIFCLSWLLFGTLLGRFWHDFGRFWHPFSTDFGVDV